MLGQQVMLEVMVHTVGEIEKEPYVTVYLVSEATLKDFSQEIFQANNQAVAIGVYIRPVSSNELAAFQLFAMRVQQKGGLKNG